MNLLLKLISLNDEDRAHCREWWAEASDAEKLQVWEAIQQRHSDPVAEIVSRFAQLAFSEMAERDTQEKAAGKE